MEILKENKMPLLGRKQVELKTEFMKQPTPSKEELKKQIATKLKVDESVLTIRKVEQKFGSNTCTITVNVYNSPELMQKYEVYKKKPKKKAAEGQ